MSKILEYFSAYLGTQSKHEIYFEAHNSIFIRVQVIESHTKGTLNKSDKAGVIKFLSYLRRYRWGKVLTPIARIVNSQNGHLSWKYCCNDTSRKKKIRAIITAKLKWEHSSLNIFNLQRMFREVNNGPRTKHDTNGAVRMHGVQVKSYSPSS